MSSIEGRVEALRELRSRGGHGGILCDGRSYWIPKQFYGHYPVDYSEAYRALTEPMGASLPQGPSAPDYGLKPGGGYKRTSLIESSGVKHHIRPKPSHASTLISVEGKESACDVSRGPVRSSPFAPDYGQKPGGGCMSTSLIKLSGVERHIRPKPSHAITLIFVEGKESACVVSRGPVEDKEVDHELQLAFIGLADRGRLKRCATLGPASKEHVDVDPCAFVSVVLNPDNPNEEFKPDSCHKDPGSRSVNEQEAINHLKLKLEDGTINETIQTAISALQCLYGENVKAHEIRVYAFRDKKEDFLSREEIERHLKVINNV